jgi:hypothetical protein
VDQRAGLDILEKRKKSVFGYELLTALAMTNSVPMWFHGI